MLDVAFPMATRGVNERKDFVYDPFSLALLVQTEYKWLNSYYGRLGNRGGVPLDRAKKRGGGVTTLP